jgi:putative flavoprotein involved in K+ transport
MPGAGSALVEPSLQLAGTPDDQPVDLAALQMAGVRLTGRLRGLDGTVAEFADDLAATVGAAGSRLARVLSNIDQYAGAVPGAALGPPDPPLDIPVPTAPHRMDLRRAGVHGVVWATGYRPWYPWLALPILDGDGRIRHQRGVTDVPGLYAIGLRFQYRRSSAFVDGVRHDAAYLVDHMQRSAVGR